MQNTQINDSKRSIANTFSVPPAIKQNNIASQLTAINSSGNSGALPKNNIENNINISGDASQLHKNNHTAQIDNITNLLCKVDKSISRSMVEKALNAGNHGSVTQQNLNLRPETALVVLTLLESEDIPSELLFTAVDLVKNISQKDLNKSKDVKDILSKKQKELDKQLNEFLFSQGDTALENLVTRYQEKYVNPEIKQKLSEYFTADIIDSNPIDSFLVSDLNMQQDEFIQSSINEFRNVSSKNFGDQYQHINNIFRHLEQKIAIIRPLSINKALSEPIKQATPFVRDSDEVDGMPYEMNTPPSGNISNSYNTTINNYYNSPFSENIKSASNQDSGINKEPEHDIFSLNKNASDEGNLFDDGWFSPKKEINLPRARLDARFDEYSSDDSPDIELFSDQSRNIENIEPNHVEQQFVPSVTREEKDLQMMKDRFGLASEVAQKNGTASQGINGLLPKMGSHYGSYLIGKKVPEGVKLTNNRELVQNKPTEPAESEPFHAIKNASIYQTSYINSGNDKGKRVVLSTEGLTTRNLNEKLAYENKP